MAEVDRVISFSLRPEDKEGRKSVQLLKDYCDLHYVVFSAMVLQAIKDLNEKLKIDGAVKGR